MNDSEEKSGADESASSAEVQSNEQRVDKLKPLHLEGDVDIATTSAEAGNRNYKALKVTCPSPGSDATARIQGHDELMRLESRRRSEVSMQMEMYQDRWHIAKDILDFAADSMDRAERLVSGFTKASEVFSSQLRAVAGDKFIDAKGGVATTWKAQNRLSKQRDFSDAIDIMSPIVSAIIESQSTMARQAEAMENSCNQISSQVLAELQELKSSVQGGSRTLKIQGGAILAEMRQAESDVKTVWDIFDRLVSNDLIEQSTHGGSMHGSIHSSMHGTNMISDFMDMIEQSSHGGSLHGSMHGTMHGVSARGSSMQGGEGFRRSNQGKKAMLKRMGGGKDCWLVAQFYKVASHNQTLAMTAMKEKMDKLIEQVIALEEKRLSGLQSLLLTGFLQRQRNLFAEFPSFNKGCLKQLEDEEIDEDSLDAFLDSRSLKRLKHSQSHRSSIMNRRSVMTGVTETLEISDSVEAFGDPFADLGQIQSSKVVELKRPGALYMMDAEWSIALVIVSKAGMFHVIQTPGKNITTETSPVRAFESLRPNMDFSSPSAWKEKSKFQLLQSLTPFVSLDIGQCIFQHSTLQRREVQVLVTGEQKPRNILFGTSGTVKCTIRLKSPMVAKSFVEGMKSMKKSITAKS